MQILKLKTVVTREAIAGKSTNQQANFFLSGFKFPSKSVSNGLEGYDIYKMRRSGETLVIL